MATVDIVQLQDYLPCLFTDTNVISLRAGNVEVCFIKDNIPIQNISWRVGQFELGHELMHQV